MTKMPPKVVRRGIPTLFHNVLFRSRLEARIAAMFDALKWPWIYEPVDLAGYIPDFVLQFPHAPIAVEVKPETEYEPLKAYAERVTDAGWERELLVVGAAVFPNDVIGVLGDESDVSEGGSLILGPGVVFRCINCGTVSLMHGDMSYRCRASGCYAGAAHVAQLEHGELAALWAAAGNRVQWRGPMSDQPGVSR